MLAEELIVGPEPDAVPTARRFVMARLDGWGMGDLTDSAALVATELVTNALLYAGAPVRLVVTAAAASVRVEVHDHSRVSPVPAVIDPEAMTGRGLALVSVVSARWGVEPTLQGKVVWAELTAEDTDAPPDDDTIIDAGELVDEVARGGPLFTVTLGEVPTDLLLAAKSHVEALSRELTLMTSGARSSSAARVPSRLAATIETVVGEFRPARLAMQRQALGASARGQARTTVSLALPLEAADAAERYLAALEEIDAYARAVHLLTLETPPEHRAFRRWYVSTVATALRQAARGEPVSDPLTFEHYMLREVAHLVEPLRGAERAARLHRVAAILAGSLSDAAVAEVVVRESMAELDATRGALLVAGGAPGELVPASGLGGVLAEQQRREAASPRRLPASDVVRFGHPVWVGSREDCDRRYPDLARLEPDVAAACAVPLVSGGHHRGVLRLSFAEPPAFDDDQRGFLVALAAAGAQALERAALVREQARLTERLRRLQTVTAAVTRARDARDLAEMAEVVLDHTMGLLGAQLCALCALEPDGHTLRMVAMRPADPLLTTRWRHFDLVDQLPASEAVRTGAVVTTSSLAERDARWPTLAGLPPQTEHAHITVPLKIATRSLGSLSLSLLPARQLEPADLDVLGVLAATCAQALYRVGGSRPGPARAC